AGFPFVLAMPLLERREQGEDDIGGLVLVAGRVRLTGHVPQQSAQRSGARRRRELLSAYPGEHAARRDVTGRGALDVSLDAGDLPGAEHGRARAQAAVRRKRARRIEEG